MFLVGSLSIKPFFMQNLKKCLILREIVIKSKNKIMLRITGNFCNISVKRNNLYLIFFTYPLVKVKNFTLNFAINDMQFLNEIIYLENWKSKRKNIVHFLDDKISRIKSKRSLKNLEEIKRFFLSPNKVVIKEIPDASISLGKLLNPKDLEQVVESFTVKAFPPKSLRNLTIN